MTAPLLSVVMLPMNISRVTPFTGRLAAVSCFTPVVNAREVEYSNHQCAGCGSKALAGWRPVGSYKVHNLRGDRATAQPIQAQE